MTAAMDSLDLSNVALTIDGVALADIAKYRVAQPLPMFSSYLPDGNIFGVPGGTYPDGVEDGYYTLLAPLSTGQHTIHISAPEWGQDVTYHLTVVPKRK